MPLPDTSLLCPHYSKGSESQTLTFTRDCSQTDFECHHFPIPCGILWEDKRTWTPPQKTNWPSILIAFAKNSEKSWCRGAFRHRPTSNENLTAFLEIPLEVREKSLWGWRFGSPPTVPAQRDTKAKIICISAHTVRSQDRFLRITAAPKAENPPDERSWYRSQFPCPFRSVSPHISDNGLWSPSDSRPRGRNFPAAARRPAHISARRGGWQQSRSPSCCSSRWTPHNIPDFFCGTPHLYLAGGALTMEIMRSQYLNQLIKKMHNGRVKIITGIRRYEKYHL